MKEVNENAPHFGKYKIKTPEELQAKVDSYFDSCDKHKTSTLVGTGANAVIMEVPDPQPYTMAGLALHVGLTSRQALLNYAERDGFDEVLRVARMRIMAHTEAKLHRPGNNNGIIFALSNNFRQDFQTEKNINVSGGLNNTNTDLTNMPPEERKKRLEELLEKRGE